MQPAAGISALSTETGVRGVIARGGAGALVPELVMGHAVILTGAVRDEGTSFHYLPADRDWQHRGWMTAKSARRQLFASAADAAVALTR